MQDLKQFVVDIPDFPKPGILFRDISPLLRRHFGATIEAMEGLFTEREWDAADAVAGIESRGFILASALAERRGKGFVPIRKKGKLPPPVVDIAYDLEYGTGVLEMQAGQGRLLPGALGPTAVLGIEPAFQGLPFAGVAGDEGLLFHRRPSKALA